MSLSLQVLEEPEAFARRLRQEFKRAERHREPLACAVLRSPVTTSAPPAAAGHDSTHPIDHRVMELIRETDIASWVTRTDLAILLPNTNLVGAIRVASRLHRGASIPPIPVPEPAIGISLFPSNVVHSETQLLDVAQNAARHASTQSTPSICLAHQRGFVFHTEP